MDVLLSPDLAKGAQLPIYHSPVEIRPRPEVSDADLPLGLSIRLLDTELAMTTSGRSCSGTMRPGQKGWQASLPRRRQQHQPFDVLIRREEERMRTNDPLNDTARRCSNAGKARPGSGLGVPAAGRRAASRPPCLPGWRRERCHGNPRASLPANCRYSRRGARSARYREPRN